MTLIIYKRLKLYRMFQFWKNSKKFWVKINRVQGTHGPTKLFILSSDAAYRRPQMMISKEELKSPTSEGHAGYA